MVERVPSLGGTPVRAKAEVPKVAWYAVVEDPDGNIFADWESDPNVFPPRSPRSDARDAGR